MLINILRNFLFLIRVIIIKDYYFKNTKSQNSNQENQFISYLSKFVKNKNGIEIGFHFNQFNFIGLYKKNFKILLIDGGSKFNIFMMRIINIILRKKVGVIHKFVEYNSTFLNKSITVPYNKNFERFRMHKSGWYHGASIVAFDKLLKSKKYSLVKAIAGINAFFVNKEILKKAKLKKLISGKIKDENLIRKKFTKLSAKQQYKKIKHLKFVKV